MITQEILVEIHVLYRQGHGIRAIARQLGVSRNTVRRYLKRHAANPSYSERPARGSKLDPYKDYLHQRIKAANPHWIPATVLLLEIQDRGYTGGISTLKSYLQPLRAKPHDPVIRFETDPGVQMQVDFTTIKRGRRSLKAFVATLGYSRASFVRFTQHERQDDWLEGIEAALDYFGGTPKEILFDNAKCIMIQRNAYGEGQHQWNKALLAQADHYGYLPRACRPYRARTKGKVERFNLYLKQSFVTPLAATLTQAGLELTREVANAHVGPWLANVAHQRIHGTTKVKPQLRMEEERFALQALPTPTLTPSLPEVTVISDAPLPIESLQHPLGIYDQLLEMSI